MRQLTPEEIKWKDSLGSDRGKAFANICIKLSDKYEVTKEKCMSIQYKIYWDSWDTEQALKNKIHDEYPVRPKKPKQVITQEVLDELIDIVPELMAYDDGYEAAKFLGYVADRYELELKDNSYL